MNKVLTVVIPSYNVEAYLADTLESFISEEIMEDVEVLIVNDGSKDTTPEIAEQFEQRYPQTFRLINKENGGHGSTINRGIEEAKGAYFKVVDGDDWVDTEDFAEMVKRLRNETADYVVTKYYKVNDKTKEKTVEAFPYFEKYPSCTFDECAGQSEIPMHALVIRTAILQKHHIRLDEHCFYVDNEYITFPVPYVEHVQYYDLTVYMYRLAVATQSVSMQGFQKHLPDHVKVTLRLVDFAEEYRKKVKDHADTKKIEEKNAERKAAIKAATTAEKSVEEKAAQDVETGAYLSEARAAYLENQAAIMVGDQAGIYASFPSGDAEIRKQFIEFDRTVRKKSTVIYDLSSGKSKMLRALRLNQFKKYRFWTSLSKVRARMRRP